MARTAKVGREKDPDLSRIRALAPDLVVADMEENRRDVVEALRAAGVPVSVTFPRTVTDGIGLIRELGALTGTDAAAAATAGPIEAAHAQVQARVAARPRVRVFCPIWRGPYMTVNRTPTSTTCSGPAGATMCSRQPRPLSDGHPRRRARAAPDVILLPDEPYRFRAAHRADFAPLADVPAVRAGRIRLVDGKLLSWYGPRIAEALERLPALLSLDA